MSVVIAIIASSAVALVVVSLYALLSEKKQQEDLTKKVRRFSAKEEAEGGQEGTALPKQPVARLFVHVAQYLGNLVKPTKKEEISLVQKRFLMAGIRTRGAMITFFGAKVVCAMCLSLGFVVAMVFFPLQIPALIAIAVVILFALAGFYLPNLWLSLKISRRQEQFLRGFPDALDLLAVSVEAGMGLDAAIKRVGEEMRISNKVLSEEFGLLNLEMRAGKQRTDALRSMADRTGLEEMRRWVAMLIQTEKFGTSIGQALRVHSDSLRTRRTQQVEELAAKLPVKLLFPTIFFIFPTLFLVILGPAAIRVYRMFH
ncbi:MAG: type II secretion system F family protein [Smithella sp.]